MNYYSIKKQEKTLYRLIELCHAAPAGRLYRPRGFAEQFDFISTAELTDILELLQSKGYIEVQYADLPDNFNINTLTVTPQGLDYKPQKMLTLKERWFERLYGFIAGAVLGSAATYFITKLLDRILGL